jgi:hypothetical protein
VLSDVLMALALRKGPATSSLTCWPSAIKSRALSTPTPWLHATNLPAEPGRRVMLSEPANSPPPCYPSW